MELMNAPYKLLQTLYIKAVRKKEAEEAAKAEMSPEEKKKYEEQQAMGELENLIEEEI